MKTRISTNAVQARTSAAGIKSDDRLAYFPLDLTFREPDQFSARSPGLASGWRAAVAALLEALRYRRSPHHAPSATSISGDGAGPHPRLSNT